MVKLLIAAWRENKHLFNLGNYRAFKVWAKISEVMKTHGYKVGGHECDKKWRNLKSNFKKLLDNNRQSGHGAVKWQYFSMMEEALAGDPAVTPNVVISSSASAPMEPTGRPPLPPSARSTTRTASPAPPAPPAPPVPPTRTTPVSDEEVPPRKRSRSGSKEPPVWFADFSAKQEEQFLELQAHNERVIEIQEERNRVLKQFVEGFLAKM